VADDLLRLTLIGEPALSPDGRSVAVAVSRLDADRDDYRSAIWLVPTEGGEPRQLTAGTHRDTAPRWSLHGDQLAFLSDRDTETPQLWLLPVSGGEARRVTGLENAVSDPVWAPDGRRIAFVSRLTPPDNNPGSDVRVINDARYKADGDGFLDGKWRHLWVVDVESDDVAPARITDGDFDHLSPAWSPTGREIAFVANREPNWQLHRARDLWSIAPGGGPPRRLTAGDGRFGLPAWSPDGRQIACVGDRKLGREAPNDELWLIPAAGGEPRSLTAAFDRSVGDAAIADIGQFPAQRPLWSADGATIAFLASDRGDTQLWEVAAAGGPVRALTSGERRIAAFDRSADPERLIIATSDPVTPFEIHRVEMDRSEKPLTRFNAAWVAETAAAWPEPVTVAAPDGQAVDGWILRPPDAAPGHDYPAILEIHGGPHAMYGTSFFHEFQLLAARGFVVIYANPRGSVGYGEAFAQALHAAWGENDTPDLLAMLDQAIAAGGIDPGRVGVTGGSYGGFMTNWLLGHSDRFKAGVTQRSLSNLYSLYGTDDIAVVSLDVEFGGPPWSEANHGRDRYLALSPITYVERITAPLLIMHSELDYRCPIEQAEQLFIALKRLGREVVFVRFPDESHGLSRSGKPKHRLERLRRIVNWFDEHL
jgi:dipeptidyl aminopeptidase/acylaminoacyl peptidase